MNMEFHARTYSSLAEQMQGVRERRRRLGFGRPTGKRDISRVDATVRAPADDEKERRASWVTMSKKKTDPCKRPAPAVMHREEPQSTKRPEVGPDPAPLPEVDNIPPAFVAGRVQLYIKRRCLDFDVRFDLLKVRTRSQPIVRIRHQLWWELRAKFHLSYTDIAIRFGGMDHTTVLHGVHKFQAAIHAGEVPNPLTGKFEPKASE